MTAHCLRDPRDSAHARDTFRDHLLELGGAAIQNGLYVSPHRWEKDTIAEAQRLGLEEHVTFASTDDLEIAGVRDPKGSRPASGPSTSSRPATNPSSRSTKAFLKRWRGCAKRNDASARRSSFRAH